MFSVRRQEGPGADRLKRALAAMSNVQGKVGWFDTAKYPDGTPVAQVAFWQEFGTKNIPPRSFMRSTVLQRESAWQQNARILAEGIMDGTETAFTAMEKIGMMAEGDIAKKIASIQSPPLKKSTVQARKRRYADKKTTGSLTKPLVDTALMINSLTHATEPLE